MDNNSSAHTKWECKYYFAEKRESGVSICKKAYASVTVVENPLVRLAYMPRFSC